MPRRGVELPRSRRQFPWWEHEQAVQTHPGQTDLRWVELNLLSMALSAKSTSSSTSILSGPAKARFADLRFQIESARETEALCRKQEEALRASMAAAYIDAVTKSEEKYVETRPEDDDLDKLRGYTQVREMLREDYAQDMAVLTGENGALLLLHSRVYDVACHVETPGKGWQRKWAAGFRSSARGGEGSLRNKTRHPVEVTFVEFAMGSPSDIIAAIAGVKLSERPDLGEFFQRPWVFPVQGIAPGTSPFALCEALHLCRTYTSGRNTLCNSEYLWGNGPGSGSSVCPDDGPGDIRAAAMMAVID